MSEREEQMCISVPIRPAPKPFHISVPIKPWMCTFELWRDPVRPDITAHLYKINQPWRYCLRIADRLMYVAMILYTGYTTKYLHR